MVLTEGETGDSLYMISHGKVKVFIGDEEGREIILKILGPGAFFLDQHSYGAAIPFIVVGIYVLSVVGTYFSVGLAACAASSPASAITAADTV